MAVAPFTRRIPKYFNKTITFTGAASLGAVGTVPIATVTREILLVYGGVHCSTLLAGATATLAFGTANNTAGLIALTTATDIDADEFWQDASPELEISPAIINQLVTANLILTVGTADVTAGVLNFYFYWLPLSPTGNMA